MLTVWGVITCSRLHIVFRKWRVSSLTWVVVLAVLVVVLVALLLVAVLVVLAALVGINILNNQL
jgi:hypothetical protein